MKDLYEVMIPFDHHGEKGFVLSDVLEKLVTENLGKKDFDEVIESMEKERDGLVGMMMHGYDAGFAMGFLYGGMFEIMDPKVSAILQELKEMLVQEGVLNILPREKERMPIKKAESTIYAGEKKGGSE